MSWAGHLVRTEYRRVTQSVVVGKFEGKRLLRRSRRRYKIIFKRTFKGWVGESWAGLIWLRIEKSDWRF